ncbi:MULTISPECIES: LysR family transcriptional regulator [Gardnerella]|uniref:Transcriptional regulator, LysR family n=1 Tax=Gardnerella vaginalis TaxID=2702 RepID=A0A135ZA50_GARVA|nr:MULTISPECIES: LysR family transcriptional regulator [Gardnerella]KXI18522.1 transcriptional regulator, LysR family [Gardnerella vaginalis]PNP89767.1 LysR family transcriptional regulator [Gardnerella sp. KA00735]
MTLLQLKYIVKIVECGSMNEASHELYISQPALSSSVKDLERELGIEIFTRSSQGIALTVEGAEFLKYARQVLDQADLLEERYKNVKQRRQLCSVATQHYMFAVEAFVEMIKSLNSEEYEFSIRETRTKTIINQVADMRADLGLLYISDYNKDVIGKMLREKHLEFHPLFRAKLHVFISKTNPLANKTRLTLEDLKPYPFIQYEQGENGSFFFTEEAVWPDHPPKKINVTDRATILNFIIGLNGYTICTGIDNGDLNNEKIVTIPLECDETMLVGWIKNERTQLSEASLRYLSQLKSVLTQHGYNVIDTPKMKN